MAEIDMVGGGKREKKKSSSNPKNNDVRDLTLRAVATFLEKNGFSRTFSTFLSESQLELNAVKGRSVDLDDIFLKFLDSSKDPDQVTNDRQEEKDVSRSQGTIERQACDDSVPQKKRKKRNGIDDTSTKLNNHDDGNNENVANAVQEESEKPLLENKQKKRKNKHLSNSSEVDNEDIPAKRVTQENENLNLGNQISETHVKSESKKKKKSEVPAEKAYQENENLNQENQIDKSNEKSARKGRKVTVEEKPLSSEAKVDSSVSEPVIENQDCSKLKDKKKKKQKTASETKIDGQLDGDVADVKNEDAVHENQDSLTSKTPNKENIHISKDTTSGNKDEVSSSKTTKKEHRHSSEPKSINPFQRVKIDEVEFVDGRLQDNSYWAKGGADTGYGAKAQEVLGQVRGRNFRHEKTKKKRGSYRGGQIDLESHSIKFNYSDDDE